MVEVQSNSSLYSDHLSTHRRYSEAELGYLLNGQFGFKTMMGKVFDGLWADENTYDHVVGFIRKHIRTKKVKGHAPDFIAIDVGAGHNSFLRELAELDSSIICRAVSLGDPRTEVEKEEDDRKNITYTFQPIESVVSELDSVNLIHCHGTLQHIIKPLALLKSFYESCAPGAEIYFEWDGKGQTSQIEWEEGTFNDYIRELQARGIDIQTSQYVDSRVFRIKVNEHVFSDDFFQVSEPVRSVFKAVAGNESPSVKSTVRFLPEKMKSRGK